ncbi:hypothetical protein vseg_013856 [Gypsophila vaccaria]
MSTVNRWTTTASSIWIQSTTGGSYAFSIYSPCLKSSQHYSQQTLDTVSVFKDIGANAGLLSGLLYAAFPRDPWLVHACGAVQCFLGYLLMWLSVVGILPRLPVWAMCFALFVAAHAQTFFNTGNVVTGVRNFGGFSGTIVGIMKGFLGLSGAILIQFYQALFDGNPSTLILILALLPTIVSLLLMCLVTVSPGRAIDDKKHLNRFSIVALVLAAYLMVIIISQNIFVFPKWAHLVTLGFLLLLILSPLIVAVKATREEKYHEQQHAERDPLVCSINTNEPDKLVEDKDGSFDPLPGTSDVSLPVGESLNIVEALQTVNFWLLFVAMSCGMGSGLATINNMSQIGQSFGYGTVKINTLVSLWSIWNFLGRFGAGYISDILLRQYGWPRPLLMAITLAAMSGGHVIIASGLAGNLYIGTVLIGICYGSQWSLMPTITSEIFGVLHMGTIFNTISIASPVGTYILSVWIIGYIYDKEAGTHSSCFGAHCFMVSFFILAFVSFLGSVISLILFFRTRSYYNSVVLRRLRNSVRL